MLVATATGAAARRPHALLRPRQVVDVAGLGQHLGARRHVDDQLGAVSPMAKGTRPVTAALCAKVLAPAKSLEVT
jgi:hypothetical protein